MQRLANKTFATCVTVLSVGTLIDAAFLKDSHAESSVTLYGQVDLGFAYQSVRAGNDANVFINPGTTFSQFAMASGQESSSRWGLKGVEDLGNGASVRFVLESAVNATDGSSSGFSRQSTLGLSKKGIGSIDLGRRLSPGTYAFAGIDPFNVNYGQASLDSSMGATNIRYSNMIAFTTESISGLSLLGGYSTDTGLKSINSPVKAQAFGTSNKFRALSLGARYKSGPLVIGALFDTYFTPSGENSSSVKQWNIGGTYDFKVVTFHAAAGQNIGGRVSGSNALANAQTSGGDTKIRGAIFYQPGARTNQWMVGLTAPMGAQSKVFASFQQMRPGGDFSVGQRSNQTISSIGYTHNLSKRTDVYAYYSYMDAPDMMSGATAQTLGAGIRHVF